MKKAEAVRSKSIQLLKEKRILIVEDEPELKGPITQLIRRVCNTSKVDWLSTGAAAAARIRRLKDSGMGSYDLIIADVTLPGQMSGIDLWRICQDLCPITPFLMISGMTFDEYLDKLPGEKYCPPFLPKPFGTKELEASISKYFNVSDRSSPEGFGSAA